jgi:hypothetical protein
VARPALHAWTDGAAPRLVEQVVADDDPDPNALACYGLLVRPAATRPATAEELWLRFVDGRPVSAITIAFLSWCCARLAAAGVLGLILVWDNAGWHISYEVQRWLRAHNQEVHRTGGVRLVPCPLPTKSPWLNPIGPKWVHGKRRVVEPARLLTAQELEDRIGAACGCPLTPHLTIPQEVA